MYHYTGEESRERMNKTSTSWICIYLSFPFSRFIVQGIKIYELRPKEFKNWVDKVVMVAETKKPKKYFDGMIDPNIVKNRKLFRRGGHVIGSVSIVGCFKVTDSHLTHTFAVQCGLTLDGLKYLKNTWKNMFAYKLEDPEQFRHTKETSKYIFRHGNPSWSKTKCEVKHHPPKNK